jgi:hypothetical protein
MSQPSFDPLAEALAAPPNLIDRTLQALTLQAIERHRPRWCCSRCPSPARCTRPSASRRPSRRDPRIVTVLGGGFVNTELRELSEPRVFDHFDFVTLDAGERPLLALLEHLAGRRSRQRLVRTFVRDAEGPVRYVNIAEPDMPFADVGTPTWDGLPLDRYLSLLDMLNPMHRLWSDGRWNKLTVAHGCYWKKCSFCDVGLDYISRYDAATAETLVDRIEAIVAETGQTGFHFVDEAAPPKSLKALAPSCSAGSWPSAGGATSASRRASPPSCARQLADSGCIAISGGLEVASDRLLALMNKGVSVDQVARVTKGFSRRRHPGACLPDVRLPDADGAGHRRRAGVRAPAVRRRLHPVGLLPPLCLHRAFAGGAGPGGLRRHAAAAAAQGFAKNDVAFVDPTGVDHDRWASALKKALYNYMHGIGLDQDVRSWFNLSENHNHDKAGPEGPAMDGLKKVLGGWLLTWP